MANQSTVEISTRKQRIDGLERNVQLPGEKSIEDSEKNKNITSKSFESTFLS